MTTRALVLLAALLLPIAGAYAADVTPVEGFPNKGTPRPASCAPR